MKQSEQVYLMNKDKMSVDEISQSMGISFKHVIHLLGCKPKKVDGVRVWK